MSISCARPPVIILGMNRSGTTLVTSLLDELGLFVGHSLQGDHESNYFLDLNTELFARVNASWDNPLPMRDFLGNADALQITLDMLARDLNSFRIAGFLGWRRFLKVRSLAGLDQSWGWKDPRTVFTLPLWLKLFPDAKLVYIVRNGVDVAASLQAREKKMLEMRKGRARILPGPPRLASHLRRYGYRGSARCLNLEGGFALWEEYLDAALANLKDLSNPLLSIRYETFLAEPRENLRQLAQFCGLGAVSDDAMAQAAKRVNPTRAGAFTADPQLSSFYARVRDNPWMVRYDYAGVGSA